MPSDMRIAGALSSTASGEAIGGPHSTVAEAVPSAATASTVPSPPHATPNPTLELDPALGLVVIQFRDANGAVTSSIPSQQQIDAYRLWQEAKVGPPPNIDGGVATPTPTSDGGQAGGAQPGTPPAGGNPPAGGQTLGEHPIGDQTCSDHTGSEHTGSDQTVATPRSQGAPAGQHV